MATSFGHQTTIRLSPDHHPAITRPQSGYHQTTNRLSPGHYQAITRPPSGYHQTTIRLSPDHNQAITRPPSGYHYIKPKTGNMQCTVISCHMGSHPLTILMFYSDAGLLARSQYPEGPALTGHLGTGFSWFPCV
jgi:hypothetical protein